jgi:hypothetical protein
VILILPVIQFSRSRDRKPESSVSEAREPVQAQTN